MSQLVTIATFNHSSEYAVLQSHLSAEGIETMVTNATSGDILSIYGIGVSPIQLKVREEDLGKARDIMRSHGFVENLNRQHPAIEQAGRWAKHLPLISRLSPARQFLVIAAVVISLLVTLVYFLFLAP